MSLEERCSRLESVMASRSNPLPCAHSRNDSIRDFTVRFARIENERRNHELIIFDLPNIVSEDRIDTASRVLLPLASFFLRLRWPVRFGSWAAVRPVILVVKLTIIARRNEILARVRRQLELLGSDVDQSSIEQDTYSRALFGIRETFV